MSEALPNLRLLSRESSYFNANFTLSPARVEAMPQRTSVDEGAGLVELSGLEYVYDPLLHLAALRDELLTGAEALIAAGRTDGYWTWRPRQFKAFLQSLGFEVGRFEKVDGGFRYLVRCSSSTYEAFLGTMGLPPAGITNLIVTTEHSDYRVTGGIGSYVKECEALYGASLGILILDFEPAFDPELMQRRKWMNAQAFLGAERVRTILDSNFDTLGDVTWEVLAILRALYTKLHSVESQEMLLNRTIEAKKIGLFPKHIKLITTCHGSSFHLAKAKRTVLEAENIHVAYREKFTLEESDVVIFPTRFLRESYRETGISNLDDASRVIKRLPFDTSRLPQGEGPISFRRILYIGKVSTVKGFDLFLETMLHIYDNNKRLAAQIEEVVVMATSTRIEEARLQELFRELEARFNVKMKSLGREELLHTLVDYSNDSLALVTYRGDNHPLAVLELMAVGHDFLAAEAAGTPELILDRYRHHNLVQPDAVSFANAVSLAFSNPKKRREAVLNVQRLYRKQQRTINASYTSAALDALSTLVLPKITKSVDGIHAYIIDDARYAVGRREELVALTRANLESQTLSPSRITVLRSEEQEGAERHGNSLHIRVYAGDILHPEALARMSRLMCADDDCAAVLAYEEVPTYEGEHSKGKLEFHPYAPQLGSVFLQEKYSRRTVGLFRGKTLGLEFTDWQCAIDAACRRSTVRIVPAKLMWLTEVTNYPDLELLRNTSMYARSFTALPRFDAGILVSELKRFDDLYWGAQLTNHLNDMYIRRDDPSISYNIPRSVVKMYHAYGRVVPLPVRKSLSWTLRTLHKARRRIKSPTFSR